MKILNSRLNVKNNFILHHRVLEEEFCLRPLTAPDVIVAYEDRRLRQSRSLDYFQKLAELNPNCGVFTNAGELISSAFQYDNLQKLQFIYKQK